MPSFLECYCPLSLYWSHLGLKIEDMANEKIPTHQENQGVSKKRRKDWMDECMTVQVQVSARPFWQVTFFLFPFNNKRPWAPLFLFCSNRLFDDSLIPSIVSPSYCLCVSRYNNEMLLTNDRNPNRRNRPRRTGEITSASSAQRPSFSSFVFPKSLAPIFSPLIFVYFSFLFCGYKGIEMGPGTHGNRVIKNKNERQTMKDTR